jgi:hypothetical protein
MTVGWGATETLDASRLHGSTQASGRCSTLLGGDGGLAGRGHVGGTIATVAVDEPAWPPDYALSELGRIVWAAMDLEGVVQSVCQAIIGAGDEVASASTGQQVKAAVAVLETWPQSETRDVGRRWLIAAQDALTGRHSILHATIVNMARPTTDGGWEIDPATWLHHVPQRGRAGVPVRLVASELQAIREVLVEARRDWTTVIVAVGTLTDERWKAGQIDRLFLTKRNRHG